MSKIVFSTQRGYKGAAMQMRKADCPDYGKAP